MRLSCNSESLCATSRSRDSTQRSRFFEEVTYFDKRLLDYDSDAQDVITQDKKTLLLDNFAKWRITDPLKVYQNFQSQRGALQRLHDIIYSELRVELGRHDLLEIVVDRPRRSHESRDPAVE